MPPRYSYWTIIAGGLPTAFRAADREELLPTFTRIKRKHPDAQMKWFARGKLWDSPESARRDTEERRNRRPAATAGQRIGQKKWGRGPEEQARGRDWRPGGEHRDPRQPYRDAKQARNAQHRKRKFERKQRFADTGERRVDQPRPSRPRAPHAKWAVDRAKPGGEREERRPENRPQRDWRGPRGFEKKSFVRNQGPGGPPTSPRPEEPRPEPRPREGSEPTPPPRPSEPMIPPPGPPERGRPHAAGKHRR